MAEKPNFDKIINSSQNLVPKRLSFDFLNSSQTTQLITKKRKMEDSSIFEVDQSTFSQSRAANDTLNSSTGSVTGIAPWEIKILRIDLAEAQTRVSIWLKDPAERLIKFIFLDFTTQEGDTTSDDNSNRVGDEIYGKGKVA